MSKQLQVALAGPLGSLEAYQSAVNAFPMLSAEEERDLARRYHDEGDINAAWHLVTSHLRFVVRIARGYQGYGLPQADLIQEGNVGLMKAVKRFDPELGVRLVSFAVHWVRAEMHEYILRNWRIVKVATTKAQRKLFFNLRGAKKRLGWLNRAEVDAVAADLGVSAETVVEMEQRLNAHDAAFDGHADHDAESERLVPAAYLEDQGSDPGRQVEDAEWTARSNDRLAAAMGRLDDRSRDIVTRRWLREDEKATTEPAGRPPGRF